ncbi:MAG: hypothetical protein HY549_02800 [Elusimicrobia bacterium]|nr:hypothetical protein [Elusimicrobiota bacterium]
MPTQLASKQKMKTNNTHDLLRLEAERMRILDLKALNRAGSGHPGATLSLAEVMSVLYFGGVLRYDPRDPTWPHRDRLVLSEGHAAPILYAALVEAGYAGWSVDALMDLRKNPDVMAQGHTTRGTPGVDCSTGALGMGGSKALGMALAARYKGQDYHTFAVIGDGESEEGQIYEAAANAAALGVDNLTWILNRNKAQQTAGIHDLTATEHEGLFRSLGWNVVALDGESAQPEKNREFIRKLRAALLKAKQDAGRSGRPTLVLVDTIKGKGVDFMEYKSYGPGQYKFHGVAPTDEELERALPLIEKRLAASESSLAAWRRQAAISPDEKRRVEAANAEAAKKRRQKLTALRSAAKAPPFPAYKTSDKPCGTRDGFGDALAHLAAKHPEIVATSPDLQDSVKMFGFEKSAGRHGRNNPLGAYFPEGIAESNACGKSAGLGLEGLIPFMGTFDNFLLEAADELYHAAAFGSFYVAVGTHSGCGVGPDGKSQMGLSTPGMIDHFSGEDGSLFEMYEPADAQEAAEITRMIVERALQREGPGDRPVYLRLTRHNVAHLDRSQVPEWPRCLVRGSYVATPAKSPDLILVASGATVGESIKAALALGKEGVQVKVINVVSLNRIASAESDFIKELNQEVPVITAHDAEPNALGHRVKDAINTARTRGLKPGHVAACLGADASPRGSRTGSGSTEENYRRNRLDAAGIASAIRKALRR